MSCNRYPMRFFSKWAKWVDNEDSDIRVFLPIAKPKGLSRGRPQKTFPELSDKAKRARVNDLLSRDVQELVHASSAALHSAGDRLGSRAVRSVLEKSSAPSAAPSKAGCKDSRMYTPVEALGYFVECRMTQSLYQWSRMSAISKGHKLYPTYRDLHQAKMQCIPPASTIIKSEIRAEIMLQALLDLTCERLRLSLTELEAADLKRHVDGGVRDFTLISKWGCDGSGSHSRYKQRFNTSSSSDSSLFMFSIVPLELCPDNGTSHVWRNPVPGSPRFCRPLKLIYEKETTELIVRETEAVKEQISRLSPTRVVIDSVELRVVHRLLLTMADVKVVNALTGTRSTQRCFICSSTTKERTGGRTVSDNIDNYSFGLATLHGWIRLLEFCLQLSYRMSIKKKGQLSKEERDDMEERKKRVHAAFVAATGLIVDLPKHGGGNTNDGNTARRFFEKSSESSAITEVSEELLQRFHVILQTLSSKYDIDPDKYDEYAKETKQLLIQLYPWFPPTPTLHKFLDHGAQIIRHMPLPIGMCTEESQEARNKDTRRFRLTNTRKTSRIDNILDLLHMLLVSSDPCVVRYCFIKPKKSKPLVPQAVNLLTDEAQKLIRESQCQAAESRDNSEGPASPERSVDLPNPSDDSDGSITT